MRLLYIFSFFLVLTACQKNSQALSDKEEAFTLLKSKCYICHTPNGSQAQRLAPPMEAIKRHYITSETSETEFTNAVVNFVLNPDLRKSKMKGAINRFGLMPQMNFEEEEVRKIASFLYGNEIEKPEWFDDHFQNHKKNTGVSKEQIDPLLEKGQKVALATKAVLGKNLMAALNRGGTQEAISFCNVKAIPLTDSMSLALNVQIARVTDQPRNPNNHANEQETTFIKEMKDSLAQGKELKPKLVTSNFVATAYYPITTNVMCLQCHGKKLTAETSQLLQQKYPSDKAVGYEENELRGMWKVVMNLE